MSEVAGVAGVAPISLKDHTPRGGGRRKVLPLLLLLPAEIGLQGLVNGRHPLTEPRTCETRVCDHGVTTSTNLLVRRPECLTGVTVNHTPRRRK